MTMPVSIEKIEVDDVTKLFGRIRALSAVSFSFSCGESVAIMGGNGAGKSTLLSLLSLLSKPTRGQVKVNGKTASGSWKQDVISRIGFLAHEPMVYPELTAYENLLFFARMGGSADCKEAVQKQIDDMALSDFVINRPCRVLSKGQLQRVSLAKAMLTEPDLLLLDEPAAGLDSAAICRIESAVHKLCNRGGMVMVVTHEPEVAVRTATRAIMLRKGKIIVDEKAPSDSDGWRVLYNRSQEGISL